MIPSIGGETHTFESRGLYDGLSLLMDYESGTWWDHVTGEAVYGPLRGEKMETFNLLHSTVEQALAAHPDIQVAISDRPFDKDWSPNTSPLSWLSQMFERTMGAEDDRVDRMDIGLGVWTDRVHRYYSMADIVDSDRALIDELDGRRILIFVSPESNTPVALYTTANRVERRGSDYRLDTGEVVRGGVLYGADDNVTAPERPLQTFTRWYGFSLTFDDPEVYRR